MIGRYILPRTPPTTDPNKFFDFHLEFQKYMLDSRFALLGVGLYMLSVLLLWRLALRKRCLDLCHHGIRWCANAILLAVVCAVCQLFAIVRTFFSITGFETEVGCWESISAIGWPLFTIAYPIVDIALLRRRNKKSNMQGTEAWYSRSTTLGLVRLPLSFSSRSLCVLWEARKWLDRRIFLRYHIFVGY